MVYRICLGILTLRKACIHSFEQRSLKMKDKENRGLWLLGKADSL